MLVLGTLTKLACHARRRSSNCRDVKLVGTLLCLLICAGNCGAAMVVSSAGNLARTEIAGKTYVRLNDWARENNFNMRWGRAGDVVDLTNRLTRLEFNKDSREAEMNGVRICLSYPILWRNGGAYIAAMDLATAIDPVLFPQKNWRGRHVRNIVIDPGHGGKDPGNQLGGHQEKKYTLLLAQELAKQLNRAGFNASLTRTSDEFIDLPVRPDIARRRGADLFISVHWNELPRDSSIAGAQTFCMTPTGASSSNAGGEVIGAGPKLGNVNDQKNMLLAFEVQQSLVENLGVEDRGVRRARYWVLRDAQMPAILIEGGFMSNAAEARRIYDAGYRQKMARAIVQGIETYKSKVERPVR